MQKKKNPYYQKPDCRSERPERKFESFVSKFKNQYQGFFKQYDYNPGLKSFWSRTNVSFSSYNETYFYSLIK